MPDKIDCVAAVYTSCAVACDLQFAKSIGKQGAAGSASVFLHSVILPLGAQHFLDGCRRENLFPTIGAAVHQQSKTVRQFLVGDAQTALWGKHCCICTGYIIIEGEPALNVLCVWILQIDGLRFRLLTVIGVCLAVPWTVFVPVAVLILLLIDCAELCKVTLREIAGHIVCCGVQLL